MSTTVLLDRCLTGSPLPGRLASIAPENQMLTWVPLLDRCLTGGKARGDGPALGEPPVGLSHLRFHGVDAWIDRETLDEQDGGIGKVDYEINFNRVFFQYQPPRPLHEIDAELAGVEQRILELLREVTE
ncbi:hypothetical protein [Acidithiobacillus ferriphilus]|uniref:hypothetical protein n=1 Tax=Acidithiobacillus ferriphilus TaxID=1689834 RepID=UPI001C074C2E|nr:hypothetical protein [Acidithiobacillus ferriphilus]